MLQHKSCHKGGLDTYIYHILKNARFSKNYYLYIYDYCNTKKDKTPTNFYTNNNNESNTWNYNLKYEDTTKDSVMNISKQFNFGDYSYNDEDNKILVKARGHIYSSEKHGQSHIVDKNTYEKEYDTRKFIGQRVLYTNDKYNIELNVFVIRDLVSRELNFFCVMCKNDYSVSINRKKSKCVFSKVNISILEDKVNDFIQYINHINLDYGRIELILDRNLGWCITDVNNSPGGGPLTRSVYKDISKIFYSILTKN